MFRSYRYSDKKCPLKATKINFQSPGSNLWLALSAVNSLSFSMTTYHRDSKWCQSSICDCCGHRHLLHDHLCVACLTAVLSTAQQSLSGAAQCAACSALNWAPHTANCWHYSAVLSCPTTQQPRLSFGAHLAQLACRMVLCLLACAHTRC